MPAMLKYTVKSNHSTDATKTPRKSRSSRSGISKMHKLLHSTHKLNKTVFKTNDNIDRPVEEPASFFGQGM